MLLFALPSTIAMVGRQDVKRSAYNGVGFEVVWRAQSRAKAERVRQTGVEMA